jgi:8-oxo-dGTP diphosphatase
MPDSLNSRNSPGVGIAVLLWHRRRVLLGQRNKLPMVDSWQLPGGWLQQGESTEQAVNRLLSEFKGLWSEESKFVGYTNNIFDPTTHSVSLYFSVKCLKFDDAALQRNQGCRMWQWADWNELPQPLFLPLHLLAHSGIDPLIPD